MHSSMERPSRESSLTMRASPSRSSSRTAAMLRLHHLLELSLPAPSARGCQNPEGARQASLDDRNPLAPVMGGISTCSESMISPTTSFRTTLASCPPNLSPKSFRKIGSRQHGEKKRISVRYEKSYGGIGTFVGLGPRYLPKPSSTWSMVNRSQTVFNEACAHVEDRWFVVVRGIREPDCGFLRT